MPTSIDQDEPEKAGYIKDFISGLSIRASKEEIDAVQPFSKRLIEDFGYLKSQVRTRPQFRVRKAPSDEARSWPVDIAVFKDSDQSEENLFMVVECKENTKLSGQRQLKSYLEHSPATIGVWFNGESHAYIRKVIRPNGDVEYHDLPNIPRAGQRLEDIGLYKRKDLQPTSNLKAVFKDIRNKLASTAEGLTRDVSLAPQVIILLFCKLYDELNTAPEDVVTFRAGINETAHDIAKRIRDLYEDEVCEEYDDVFDDADKIRLDDESIAYVVGELQNYCIMEAERDVISDAFHVFISKELAGAEDQFITPKNATKLITRIINPQPREYLIDPACGHGGFLIPGLQNMWAIVADDGARKGWTEVQIEKQKKRIAEKYIRGIDKDGFFTKITKAYMAIIGDGRGGIVCDNSLKPPSKWKVKTQEHVHLDYFNVVMTNPPFGKKLRVTEKDILKQFDLGYQWKYSTKSAKWEMTDNLLDSQTPQILFVERCIELLKEGGRMGIVLPESIFCNPSHQYIVKYILSKGIIKTVLSMPEQLFQPYTHAKTALVVFEKRKKAPKDYPIFMGIAKWCGHDSRGITIPYDDLPKIEKRYEAFERDGTIEYDHLGFVINRSSIIDDIFLPKYYNPELSKSLESLRTTHELVKVQDLIDQGLLSVSTGHEIGKLSYGTGDIPFIRSSDISNWEIKVDPKQGVSKDIYEQYRAKQDVKEHDILMVRDGTYLVGTCAMITKYDPQMVYQSHIYKIRSLDHNKINPYLLLAVLSSPIVKQQIFSKRFTQDIIDTLGRRLYELILPIPKDAGLREKVINDVRDSINSRVEARETSRRAAVEVATPAIVPEELE